MSHEAFILTMVVIGMLGIFGFLIYVFGMLWKKSGEAKRERHSH